MKETRNQSVRYSEVMSNLGNDSLETPSPQLSLTRKKKIKLSKRHKILLGVGLFELFIVVVVTVAIVFSIHSNGNDSNTTSTWTASILSQISPVAMDDRKINIRTKSSATNESIRASKGEL